VAHVLNSVGKKAKAVGNIGAALSEYLLQPNEAEILVVELSSYQLETMQAKKLQAAVVLNLTPDHLERYLSMKEYGAAKARIQDCLAPGGKLFVSKQVPADLFHVPFQIFDKEIPPEISNLKSIRLGVPEAQNVQAAFALCAEFGVKREEFDRALQTFRKPAHRIEWIGEKNGVHFYNDSKATNIDSVMHAMALFDSSVILILGGVDKGASYRPWIESFRGKVKKMVAYGEAASKMESELSSYFPFTRVKTMEEAVQVAKREAKAEEVVLLSPGCSSYDQFRSYAHRGDEFKRLVKELP
jgi:UDP-N-acetylmuramoylalanine--D-glutamate ligase